MTGPTDFGKSQISYAMKVREIGTGGMHEFAIMLDKAGFDSSLIQKIVNAKDNYLAKSMYKVVIGALAGNDSFECVLETDFITIPNMGHIRAYVGESWGADYLKIEPSYSFLEGTSWKIKLFRIKKELTSKDCVDFIRKQNLVLPNVFGLAIAEMTISSYLPKTDLILGLDDEQKLSVSANGKHLVPWLRINVVGGEKVKDGSVWSFPRTHNTYFLAFSK